MIYNNMASKSYYCKVFTWCLIATASSGVTMYVLSQKSKEIALVSMSEFVTTMTFYSLFEYYWPVDMRENIL